MKVGVIGIGSMGMNLLEDAHILGVDVNKPKATNSFNGVLASIGFTEKIENLAKN
jgi:6-phosphogluconate dehydrogenase (decarboxylating)